MNHLLKDKVVIITGGAGLLGKEFVKTVVENGGYGVIADVNIKAGQRVAKELKAELKCERIDFVKLDITSRTSVKKMLDYLGSKYGKIDALVNNAYPRNKRFGRKFEDVTYEDFCENVNLHLGGYFLVSQQLAAFFKKQGYGNVVNISSIYGVIPPRFDVYEGTKMTVAVEYAVIKSALIHLAKYMAKYLKGSNIRVNSISPGGISGNQPKSFLRKYNDLCLSKGMLNKADLKGTLVYLLSDMSKCVNGQNIIVDDGFCL